MLFWVKVLVSAFIVAIVSEVAKRSSVFAAIIASLPLISILAIFWLYFETREMPRVISLTQNIFWAVLPSLLFFLVLPLLLKAKLNFYLSLGLASAVMVVAYTVYVFALGKFGIRV